MKSKRMNSIKINSREKNMHIIYIEGNYMKKKSKEIKKRKPRTLLTINEQ